MKKGVNTERVLSSYLSCEGYLKRDHHVLFEL